MIAHVVSVLRRATDEVWVVGTPGLALPDLDARIVEDREPGLGPLGGIYEGLCHIDAELAYVTGTDAPFLSPEFARCMLAFGKAAAPVVDGHVHTMAAVYPRALADRARALIGEKKLRPLYLLEADDYVRVGRHELPDLDSLRGFNTPDEYLRAVREEGGKGCATVEIRRAGEPADRPCRIAVPIGTLAEILERVGLEMRDHAELPPEYSVVLEGSGVIRDLSVPIGPGERMIVSGAESGHVGTR
jgi:molybdopterin-guanine dinucleotide biosynthesis protein A